MKRTIAYLAGGWLLLAALTCLAREFEFQDTRLVRIDDPVQRQFGAAARDEQIAEAIRLAAAKKRWVVESEAPGRAVLTTIVRSKHKAKVEVRYTAAGYRIDYLDSSELLYDEKAEPYAGGAPARAIHQNYNVWVRELAAAIDFAVASVQFGSVGSNGLPAAGATWKYAFRDQLFHAGVRTFSIEVLGVKGAVVEERLRVDGGDISQTPIDASELRFHARPLASDRMLLELAPYWAAVAKDVRQVPVGYPVGPLNWSIAAPSYRDERVTVPAGSFATVRVQVTGRSAPIGSLSNTTANFATRFVYTYWYSPEHARYVKIRHQTWNQVNQGVGDEVVELLRYESP